MFGKSYIFRGLLANAQKAIPYWRVFRGTLAVVLVLGMGSAAPSLPVHAAQMSGNSRVSYGISLTELPKKICAGQDHNITVKLTKHTDFLSPDGWVPGRVPAPMGAVMVEAFATDPGVGTVAPASRLTGWLAGDAPGEAVFKFQAIKAGDTKLYFEALPEGKYIDAKETVKVVDCKYKVTMNATDVLSGDGVTLWTSGNLNTTITGDGGEMTGSGAFAFDSGFSGPPCGATYSEYQNPTTITGQIGEDDQLTLHFDYQPGEITANITCPEVGTRSASLEVDLTNTGITSVTFPAVGGTRVIIFTMAGSDMPPGTMIINVEPVSDEEGGLSS